MTKHKSTKQSLLSSVIALVLCFTMLLGTTLAWFTDIAINSGNRVQAGILNVDLLKWIEGEEYISIDETNGEKDSLFEDTFWQPDETRVVYLAIENKGNIDLKYSVNLTVSQPDGQKVSMTDVMQYAITPDAKNGAPVAWDSANAKTVVLGSNSVGEATSLGKGETHYFALSVHMDENAGDEYQGKEITFDMIINATQVTQGEVDDVAAALARYDRINESLVDFFIELYDPETGGFTYTPSANKLPGYEADLEATATILSILPDMGLISKTDPLNDPDVPEGFYEKMLKFFQDRQSEEDGYWWNELYGNTVVEATKLRTESKSANMIKWLGGEPLYLRPLERVESQASVAAVAENAAARNSSLPAYYDSAEAYVEYFEKQNWETGAYGAGSLFVNTIPNVKALGYEEEATEFILSKQNATTGLWGDAKIDSDSINGSLKVADALYKLGVEYPYPEEALASVITFVESEQAEGKIPANICTIWNSLQLIQYIRLTYNGVFPGNMQEVLDKNLVTLLDLTYSFLEMFKTKDGGFKYYVQIPMAEAGITNIGIGLDSEGNMEGNYDSVVTGGFLMRNTVYALAGVSPSPMWAKFKTYFWNEIEKKMKAPIVKQYEEGDVYSEDFDDIASVEDLYDTWTMQLQGDAQSNRAVVADPKDSTNKVLMVKTAPTTNRKGANDQFKTNFKIPEGDVYTAEFKFMIDSKSTMNDFNFYLGSNAVAVTLSNSMTLSWATMTGEWNPGATAKTGVIKEGLEKDTWYTLKIVYQPDGKENTKTIFYLDDVKLAETDKYFTAGFDERFPVDVVRGITVKANSRSNNAIIYMDDIHVSSSNAE